MPLAGFEPTIPSSERPQTHALDRSATGIGNLLMVLVYSFIIADFSESRAVKLTNKLNGTERS
jgi:hypothetical protein